MAARPIIEVTGPAEVIAGPDDSISLSVPIRFKRRAGPRRNPSLKKPAATEFSSLLLTPNQRLLGRAFRWSRMIEREQVASMSEIAWRERKDPSYVARIINLTMLAPDIIKAILDDTLPRQIQLNKLAIGLPVLWEEQRQLIESKSSGALA